MKLPDGFLECMKDTLKEDFEDYFKYIDKPPYRGLRVNTLKADTDFVRSNIGFETKPLPFSDKGFYINNNLKGVGNHPFHHCGAIYLQEPSAMSAVTVLDVQPGEKVLDMCAAPGGKSTQIAAQLNGEGLLWSNEYIFSRAKVLYSNIERCGIKNAVISNADSAAIAENLSGYFDKVLVDAPCSGEGMIRREQNAVNEWKIANREMCAVRQAEILDNAAKCVKSFGTLVYSTCTLSIEENEQSVEDFLKRNKNFELTEISQKFGRSGYTYFTDNDEIKKCRRILFQDGGEGHFIAKFQRIDETESTTQFFEYDKTENNVFSEFYQESFNDYKEYSDFIFQNMNNIYILPKNYPKTNGIRILKSGVKAGELAKKRFIPSHELYMSKALENIKSVENISINDKRIFDFLHGLEIDSNKKGYTAVAVNGIITGFGKASNGKLKNHYPKGLRIL